jgi:hypothetical protein
MLAKAFICPSAVELDPSTSYLLAYSAVCDNNNNNNNNDNNKDNHSWMIIKQK